MKVLILAGGFATRLWPLTEKTAKPLILLAGKPLISWILEALPGDLEVIVSTNSVFAADFENWKKTFLDRRIEIFVEDAGHEEEKKGALFATALAIRERKITEDLLLIAGDNYFGFSLQKFLGDFKSAPEHVLLAAYDIQDEEKAKNFGVVVPQTEASDLVASFQEKPEQPRSTLVSTGCFAFPKRVLPEILHYAENHRDDLGKIFEHLLDRKETIRLFSFSEPWFDIGSFSSYLAANDLLLQGKTLSEDNVRISPDAKINGSVFLGENTRLGENVVLENAVILEGCSLENCEVRNAVVGKNTVISGIDLNHKIIRDESFLAR